MDFIVDAMLPFKLSEFLKQNGHNSVHTLELPSNNFTTDNFINDLSIKEKRVVTTKDSDFEDDIRVNLIGDNLGTIINALENAKFIEINESGMTTNF
jgi:predicted nuclease of predicted toxin-antitoxin system